MKWLLIVFFLVISGCAGTRPNIDIPESQPSYLPIKHKPRVVVVLGSGGARGYAHLGVLQAFKEAHIPIDGIVCASAGCIVGALYADNLDVKKTFSIMMHASFWDFADVANTPSIQGPMKGYRLQKFLLRHMAARTFDQLKIPLLVATTDLYSGHSYLIRGGPIAPAVLASSALPGLVQPVYLYGHSLIDGGVAAPVPVKFASLLHPKVIIAVNIAQTLSPKIHYSARRIYARARQIIWLQLTDLSEDGADVIVRPQVGVVGTFDLSQKYQMYQAGLAAGRSMILQIRKRLIYKGVVKHSAMPIL